MTTPPRAEIERWHRAFSAAAQRTLGEMAVRPLEQGESDRFTDEGHTRLRLAWWLLAFRVGESSNFGNGHIDRLPAPATGDERLWHALLTRAPDAEVDQLVGPPRDGPLVGELHGTTIEVFTEQQLAGLHALWDLAARSGRTAWRDQLWSSVRWTLGFLQPDNATNHPWAAHVFVLSDYYGGTIDGRMYADTLLHNCQVTHGGADRLSAHILADSARALRQVIDQL